MELLIDKKYLVRLERYTKFGYGGSYDPFAVRYVFSLPKNAGLPDGYTVYIDAQRVKRGNKTKKVILRLMRNRFTQKSLKMIALIALIEIITSSTLQR